MTMLDRLRARAFVRAAQGVALLHLARQHLRAFAADARSLGAMAEMLGDRPEAAMRDLERAAAHAAALQHGTAGSATDHLARPN